VASEYVTADTFDVALRRLAPLPLARAVPMLRQMAEALDAARAAGHLHGALHPRDVFVAADGTDDAPDVRIGGFGVATALEAEGVKVPPRRPYAAPERVAGRLWDARADVFSLGVLAHELLTGRRPAGAGEQDGALPTGTTPEQRVAIRRALHGVLAEDPERRYATPSAFIAALETGEAPVVADAVRPDVEDAGDAANDAAGLAGEDPPPPFADLELAPPAPAPAPAPAQEAVPAPESTSPPEPIAPVAAIPIAPHRGFTPAVPPVVYLPPPPAPVLSGAAIGLVAAALVGGAAIGFWLRGGATPMTGVLPTVSVLGDDPVGTDVPVTEPLDQDPAGASPPAPSAAAAPVSRGRLLVRSQPAGARVMISGRVRGTTPATIRDLPFGTYNVTVSRAGYQTTIERVTVSRTVPARDITVELRRAATPAASSTAGAIYVQTRPSGARVTLDGRALGTTPMRVPDVAPGTHTLRLELAGHKTLTTTVVVRAGQVVPVRVSLEVM
jgi:serine/threonine-protein kinase